MKKLNRRDFLKLSGLSSLLLTSSFWNPYKSNSEEEGIPPNILVIVFDSLSAKHMSLYGYERKTTPHLERLAQRAIVFHRHYAGGNFTNPGTASFLTGTYPWKNRGFIMNGLLGDIYQRRNIFSLLDSKYHTFAYTHNPIVQRLLYEFRHQIDDLPEISKLAINSHAYADRYLSKDYYVASLVEKLALRRIHKPSSAFFLSRFDWLARYRSELVLKRDNTELFPVCVPGRGDGQNYINFTLEDAMDWVMAQTRERPKPYFGYVHLLPPHDPYCTHKDFYGRFQDKQQFIKKPEHHFSLDFEQKYLKQLQTVL
jgi:hypothetical protein